MVSHVRAVLRSAVQPAVRDGKLTLITWTSEVYAEEGLHFVTLHHRAEVAAGEPQLLEPEKCDGWDWYAWHDLPQPLFAAAVNLIATGWRPAA